MQIFKAYFKVINKNLIQIMIYVIVFFALTVILSNTYENPASTGFIGKKVNIAFINQDSNSILVSGLKEHLSKNTNIVSIEDDTQKLQDALFFREIEYIIRLPAGLTEGLLNNKEIKLEKTTVPDSANAVFIDNLVNNYLITLKTYIGNMKGASQDEILKYVKSDLEKTTEVKLKSTVNEISKKERCEFYFNFLSYSLFAMLILGVGAVMMVFNNEDLKKRNFCSPKRLNNINFQLIFGNISYAVIAWFIMIVASFIMFGSIMFSLSGVLFLVNSFVFAITALSISFLISNLIKSKNAMSAVANVFSLGTGFISGVFVPQALLGKTVLTIASFTPTYWYVKSNNLITKMDNINMDNMAPVFVNMLIMIGFAIAVLAVSLVYIKQKRMSK